MPNTNYPTNDDKTLYIACDTHEMPFSEMIEQIKSHFGEDSNLDDFTIEAEYRHVECIGYDAYDPSDYTNYLVIRKN